MSLSFETFIEKYKSPLLIPDSLQSNDGDASFLRSIMNEDIHINISNQNSELNDINNNNITQTEKSKKRSGRKRKIDGNNGRFHDKKSKDNIQRKIQVHFFNKFLLLFINEILIILGFKEQFININYEIKKNIKNEYVNKLKKTNIGEIFKQEITPKNKIDYNKDKDKNKKVYEIVVKKSPVAEKILSDTYINVFRKFYFKNNRNLNNYGLNVTLSKNVETFEDFLNKKNIKDDYQYKEKIIEVVQNNYLVHFKTKQKVKKQIKME